MKRSVMRVLVVACLIGLMACGPKKEEDSIFVTNLGSQETFDLLDRLSKNVGLKDMDQVKETIEIFNSTNKETTYPSFVPLKEVNYDPYVFNNNYLEKHKDFYDMNCRETLYKIFCPYIDVKEEDFSGTYLMFDQEDLEKNPALKDIPKRKYSGLFNEVDSREWKEEDYEKNLQEALEKKAFKNANPKGHLISVYLEGAEKEALFVGHCGLLMKEGDKYYFFEKLAVNEPFNLLSFKKKEDLFKVLRGRYREEGFHDPILTEDLKIVKN